MVVCILFMFTHLLQKILVCLFMLLLQKLIPNSYITRISLHFTRMLKMKLLPIHILLYMPDVILPYSLAIMMCVQCLYSCLRNVYIPGCLTFIFIGVDTFTTNILRRHAYVWIFQLMASWRKYLYSLRTLASVLSRELSVSC